MKKPYLFDEFFQSGKEESISPFLTRSSRGWGKHLPLKSAAISALCLSLAFACSFSNASISNLFLAIVFFLSGTPALIESIEDLKNLEINIDVLMTVAAFLAVAIDSGLEGGLLLVLFEISGALEETVSRKALTALHNLNNLAPKFAYIAAPDGTIYEKSVREIEVGTRVLVKAGEVVPLDGIVRVGISSVNLVHLTGESIPNSKQIGDEVPSGARNLDAALVIEVTRTSTDSTISRIVKLIHEAQEAKPKLQRWLDSFGKIYATAVISLTFLFAMILPFLASMTFFGPEGSVYRALAFLIAASPCALIIATPTAYLSAISACAKKGILLKGGVTLDALSSCRTIAFDKTGTLTTGDLLCTAIQPLQVGGLSDLEAIGIAAALERQVVHPISTAIVRLAQEKKAPSYEISQFRSIPGSGVEGMIQGNIPVAIGRPEYVAGRPIPPDPDGHVLAALRVGQDLYLFRFTDQIREEIPALMDHLRERLNLTPVMLTGDNEHNANNVGTALGIKEIFANLRPEDKLAKVAKMAAESGLAMVGDGVNDAPALARSTVGISMGRIGSATAIDASDAILLNDDIHLLGWLFSKAHLTQRIVKQNLTIALLVILLATTPALLGFVPLWMAVLLHEGGTVLVGINSLRLLRS